jgi:hypothetical protein
LGGDKWRRIDPRVLGEWAQAFLLFLKEGTRDIGCRGVGKNDLAECVIKNRLVVSIK